MPSLGSLRMLSAIVVAAALSFSLRGQEPTRGVLASLSDLVGPGELVPVPRARQFDFTSKVTGREYRLMIAPPRGAKPDVAYPVVYLMDGYWNFATASLIADNPNLTPAIIVGIGYPTEDRTVWSSRRALDLTFSKLIRGQLNGPTGDGDAYLRMIEEEIKPFVSARYKTDPTKQTLYGASLGGLMVLRQMFRNPTAYSCYIASSPSIFYNDREVLKDEESFAKLVRGGAVHLKLFLGSAANEQYRGKDPQLLAGAEQSRMVDNASELAARLSALNPKALTVMRVIFEDEDHNSGSLPGLGRSLRFALSSSISDVDPETLARYIGAYEVVPGVSMLVTIEDDQLVTRLGSQPAVPIYPESSTLFFAKIVQAKIEFADPDAAGVPRQLILHQNGRDQTAKRLSDAEFKQIEAETREMADAAAAAIQRGARNPQTPDPRTEAALRRDIDELRQGQPNYEKMSSGLAGATRRQLPQLTPRLNQLGAVESVTFKGVGPGGLDIYEVKFEHGTTEWRILMQSDEKIGSVGFRAQ